MKKNFQHQRQTKSSDYLSLFVKQEEKKWSDLQKTHLPLALPNSIWRYSESASSQDASEGWKIHVSATILTANEMLQRLALQLKSRRVKYKAPRSLAELMKINAGIFYGYSQIGKFITVYPRSEPEALEIAETLHQITCDLNAPTIPFDNRYKINSNVYYRY